ncbi:MAG: coproporphyrinogen III oxidase family protein [Dehalococcoidales bacterium]|nr:coproporphyrinogen III oxidase family protein [Dehalococcoidales bacterium]
MIAGFLGLLVKREGRKFRRLEDVGGVPAVLRAAGSMPEMPALYVHIPFCRSLCPFCCFNRYLFREELVRRYFADLKRELEQYIGLGFRFSRIYFGGGTPTVLMNELLGFIDLLHRHFSVEEISLETTPRELTEGNVGLLRGAGISRLSVGVQSFDDQILRAMGRVNGPAEEVKKRLLLAEGRFRTLNVDFVFNFPGQRLDQFATDISVFKSLGIDQATFYPLMASPHKKDALERRFNRVDNSREKRFYNLILDAVYHEGYKASTVWCFSRGDHLIDEYIVESDDYIGIGAGSVSIVRDHFLVNTFSVERYHELTSRGELPLIGMRKLSPGESRYYYLLTKLFGMKLDTRDFLRRFGRDSGKRLGFELALLKAAGVLRGDSVLQVTENGMYTVSVMMREFFTALNSLREHCIENQL